MGFEEYEEEKRVETVASKEMERHSATHAKLTEYLARLPKPQQGKKRDRDERAAGARGEGSERGERGGGVGVDEEDDDWGPAVVLPPLSALLGPLPGVGAGIGGVGGGGIGGVGGAGAGPKLGKKAAKRQRAAAVAAASTATDVEKHGLLGILQPSIANSSMHMQPVVRDREVFAEYMAQVEHDPTKQVQIAAIVTDVFRATCPRPFCRGEMVEDFVHDHWVTCNRCGLSEYALPEKDVGTFNEPTVPPQEPFAYKVRGDALPFNPCACPNGKGQRERARGILCARANILSL